MSISAADERNFIRQVVENEGIRCKLCGIDTARPSHRRLDWFVPLSMGGKSSVENAIMVCDECSVRRRKRPLMAYATDRLAELSLEIRTIQQLHAALLSTQVNGALVAPLSPEVRNAAQELVSEPSQTMEELLADWDTEDAAVKPVSPDSPLFAKPAAPTVPTAKPRFGEPGFDLDADWDAA